MSDEARRRTARFERTSTGLEFERVAFFSDAVFAIAMTLLVVGIGIPTAAAHDLGHALGDRVSEILSFFISFFVIGYYWVAHHRFVSRLVAFETGIIVFNLAYLAAIAFVPFPTALVGQYTGQAIAVVLYATTLGIASFLEAAMFVRAQHMQLFRRPLPDDVFRYATPASLAPVAAFAVAIPVAFVDTTLALLCFAITLPIEFALDRTVKPDRAGEYLG